MANFGWDNSFSVAAAKSISDGHGYKLKMASSDDLSRVTYKPLNLFPPGYSLLLSGIHAVSFTDWIHSVYILNALGLILLILVFRKMLYQLDFPVWIINIAVLYFGFIDHPYYGDSFTDLFGVVFFISGCSILFHCVKSGKKSNTLVVLAALLLAFCVCLRYMYLGVCFVPFLFLLYYGYEMKNKIFIRSAFTGLIILTCALGIFILFQLKNSGQSVYINPIGKGFFPDQLLLLGQVFFASFASIDFILLDMSRVTSISHITVTTICSLVNFALLAWIVFSGMKLVKNRNFLERGARGFYAMLSLWVGASFFLILGILTVRYSKYLPTRIWVYFGELRYFGPVYIMIIQFSIYNLLNPGVFLNAKLTWLFRTAIIILAVGQIWHSSHTIINHVLLSKDYGTNRETEYVDVRTFRLASNEIANNRKVVIYSSSPESSNIGSLSGASCIDDISIFKKPLIASDPVVLITVLNEKDNRIFGSDVLKSGRLIEHQNGGAYIYVSFVGKSLFKSGMGI